MFLGRIPYRYLTRHPWQSLLMVLGITLGVAVAVAIDLANASASRAFDLSTDAVAGRATHTIVGGPQGLDESLYAELRRSGKGVDAAPVISEYVSSTELGGGLLQLLGVDAFAEAPFRDYLSEGGGGVPPLVDLVSFLARPGALILSSDLAQRYALQAGDPITLEVGGRVTSAFVAALITPRDELSRRALDSLLLADIATAQEITGQLGRLNRIDLIVPTTENAAEIQAELPEGIRLQPVSARTGSIEQMTAAFRVNLTALSLLALVVGLFLIYNTMTFSVVQRRSLFGTLRCLGMTRREVYIMVLGEALLVGAAGSGLGLAVGVVLGQGAVQLVTRTINDLYFVVNVQGLQIPPSSLVKGALLGILATVFTAALPAWEAASAPPRLVLSRSGLETKARRAVWLAAVGGLLLFLLGGGLLLLPTHDLVISFAGTSAVVVGFAMLAPTATLLLSRAVTPLAGWLWGALGRMAPRNVVHSLSRTSVATAALMVAVSVSIGVSLMVGSFRHTVIAWLDQILQGDIYISAPSLTATQTSAPIEPRVLDVLAQAPDVLAVHTLRAVSVDSPLGIVNIAAGDNLHASRDRSYLALEVPLEVLPERMAQGAVLVSEPFANRYNLPLYGAIVPLFTDRGRVDFPVAGIYYDYASTAGTVLMSLDLYRQFWDDPAITAVSLDLPDGLDADRLAAELQTVLNPLQKLSVRPNRVLRAEVLEVFDRTFAITGALQLLATLVAFIGVLSALLSLELERQHELGILRSLGLTARQLWGLILLETGLLGSVAGLLAMPTGFVLALILVYIINRRSFGWTLQMLVLPEPFIQALLLAVTAALLAGIYPAWRMSRMSASDASRFD